MNDVTEEGLADLEGWNYQREQGDDITEEELAELEQWNHCIRIRTRQGIHGQI